MQGRCRPRTHARQAIRKIPALDARRGVARGRGARHGAAGGRPWGRAAPPGVLVAASGALGDRGADGRAPAAPTADPSVDARPRSRSCSRARSRSRRASSRSRSRRRRPPRPRSQTRREPDGSETLRGLRKDVRVWAGRTEALLPRLRAPFEPIERAVNRVIAEPVGTARAFAAWAQTETAQLQVLPGAAAALLVLLMISLLRGWGDAVIAIEYPSELRGAFSVHLSRSQAGCAPASAHQQPERGASRPAPGERLQPQSSLHGVARDAVPAGSGPGAGGSPSTGTSSPRAAQR